MVRTHAITMKAVETAGRLAGRSSWQGAISDGLTVASKAIKMAGAGVATNLPTKVGC